MKLWTLSNYGQIENTISNSTTINDIEQILLVLKQ